MHSHPCQEGKLRGIPADCAVDLQLRSAYCSWRSWDNVPDYCAKMFSFRYFSELLFRIRLPVLLKSGRCSLHICITDHLSLLTKYLLFVRMPKHQKLVDMLHCTYWWHELKYFFPQGILFIAVVSNQYSKSDAELIFSFLWFPLSYNLGRRRSHCASWPSTSARLEVRFTMLWFVHFLNRQREIAP